MKFIVTKSTESTNGGYINTLKTTKVINVLGVQKTVNAFFLLKTDEKVPVDSEHNLNLADFKMEERPWVDDNGEARTSTWLHVKVA